LQTYREQVSEVTADDVLNFARKYVNPDRMSIVIVGDGEEIMRQAREFSDVVEVFDIDAKPLSVDAYNQSAAQPADAGGKWNLTLDFQGETVPVSLTVDQNDGHLTGTLETILGAGKITEGKISGRKLSATATTDFQGQSLELTIAATIEGDSINGTIATSLIPTPLNFRGTRES
ncbi:MAG: insulinase family protein, partial [Acidobacteria bacterium]|nr:insulinase family protein [Acidobacteriota bacterium]